MSGIGQKNFAPAVENPQDYGATLEAFGAIAI